LRVVDEVVGKKQMQVEGGRQRGSSKFGNLLWAKSFKSEDSDTIGLGTFEKFVQGKRGEAGDDVVAWQGAGCVETTGVWCRERSVWRERA
jgi:hypothetical protein